MSTNQRKLKYLQRQTSPETSNSVSESSCKSMSTTNTTPKTTQRTSTSSTNHNNSKSSSTMKRSLLTVLLATTSSVKAQTPFLHSSPVAFSSSWTASSQVSNEVALPFSIPLFGTGTIDSIWISVYGALSYNKLSTIENTIDDMKDNIAIAPYFVPSSSGNVQYEITGGAYDYSDANADVGNFIGGTYTAVEGLLVSWTQTVSAADSNDENTFQAFIVSDGASAYVVYNYADIQYTTSAANDDASAGLFVNSEDTNSCWRQVNGTSLDREALESTTNCAAPGHWVMRLDDILLCSENFVTACGDDPPSGEWTNEYYYFENNDRWDFFVRYECKNELELQPNSTIKDSYCVYDPDYYDSKWSCDEAPQCQDFRVASQFETQVVIQAEDDGMRAVVNDQEAIQEAVNQLLQAAGLEDGVVVDITTEKTNVESFRELGDGEPDKSVLVVEFTILVPTPAGGTGIAEEDIAAAINEVITQNPGLTNLNFVAETNVKDKTDACLTLCLGCKKPGGCFGVPPPIQHNACCGTCSSMNYEGGKAYSTLTHACCGDQFVYDPDTHSCCDYGTSSMPSWTKVKGDWCS